MPRNHPASEWLRHAVAGEPDDPRQTAAAQWYYDTCSDLPSVDTAKRHAVGIAVVLALLFSQGSSFAANQATNLQVDLPYSLGIAKQTVMPEEIFMMRTTVFHPQMNRERVTVQIEVPQGIEFVDANEIWTHEERHQEQIYQKEVEFSEGYGNWFDFLRFQAQAEGEYSFTIKVISEEKTFEVKKVLTVRNNLAITAGGRTRRKTHRSPEYA